MARSLPLDNNRNPITNFDNGIPVRKTIDLSSISTSASSPFDIFTVTGVNLAKVWGVCKTDLVDTTSSISVSIGFSGSTSIVLGETTAIDIDEGELWTRGTGGTFLTLGAIDFDSSSIAQFVMRDSTDIIGTMTGHDAGDGVTSGIIDFYCLYVPMTDEAEITAV